MTANIGHIVETPIRLELESRYLAYALSTIISRSLPDVRDGLKPVHRRILFAMRSLRLDPGLPYKKSARVVGDVIGKYHPHGDQAAYDAMVRLAQEFAARYPLVDGQGNFGNVDGDSAAAMRYTEARLTKVARALMEDLDSDTVDFTPTYDGSDLEPRVFPARFPNLLANGSTGIAVGMSTSIPPHNVGEILDACLLLIKQPETTLTDLMNCLPGPDFPSGGVLVSSRKERLDVYTSGRGSLRLRGRWHKEDLPRGAWQLVVTEIPYQVQKSRLIERIAQLILTKVCPFLSDVRDESDELIRIVLDPRSNQLEPELVMAYLFKNSDLEVRVTINLNCITAAVRPQVLNLKEILQAWLNHRFEVSTRRAQFELRGIAERLHLLAAHLIAHLNIDEVIAIIKEHDRPAPVLMARFGLDEDQAEAVLNLRLRALRRLEEMKIRKEMEEKEARAKALEEMLADNKRMWRSIQSELKKTRTEFADPRRTDLAPPPKEITLKPEDLAPREPITLIFSHKGWIKSIRGHDNTSLATMRFKGEDRLFMAIKTFTNDTLGFVAKSGKVFSLLADKLPSGKGFGDPISVLFDVDGGDPITWVLVVDAERDYFVTTRLGQGFRVRGADMTTNYRAGKQLITFKADDSLLHIHPIVGTHLASIGQDRRMLICTLEEFPLLPKGRGVRIQRLPKNGCLIDATTFNPVKGVTLDNGKRQKTLTDLKTWLGRRAGTGSMLPHGFLSGAAFVGTGVPATANSKGSMDSLPYMEDV